MTSEAFLAAFKRFIGRRGKITTIYSDNGTNFVGANNELKNLSVLFQTDKHKNIISKFAIENEIKWKFIPPRSPHVGGLWEAGVKSFKYHLKRIAPSQNFTFEELCTLSTQIEACLNSRPLTPLSTDPNDPKPLTPGHFLTGDSLIAICEPDLQDINENRLSRWQRVQQLNQSFWKIWHTEYLQNLQKRYKWNKHSQNVKIDDIVLIQEDNLPPTNWLMGRIIKLHPGKDGIVRIVTLKTQNGETQRTINKISPFPHND